MSNNAGSLTIPGTCNAQALHPILSPAIPVTKKSDMAHCLKERDNHAALQYLLDHCQHQHPDADKIYWSTRVWRSIIWQPIYACVGATHLHHISIDVTLMRQKLMNGTVNGFTFNETNTTIPEINNASIGPVFAISTLVNSAYHLKALLMQLMRELDDVIRINKRNCTGLIADMVSDALIQLHSMENMVQRHQYFSLLRLWCYLLNLTDRQGLPVSQRIFLKQSQVFTERRSCCKHNVIVPNNACLDCPQTTSSCNTTRII
ncbi:hypothetical protein TDB9533_04576 [Thalassocella blandensis]|nr:hypothetical protein TDB9533_04576 [Thalassocella blandensis]